MGTELTGKAAHYEIFPVEEWKFPAADLATTREIVRQCFGLALPGPRRWAALLAWFQRPPGAVRAIRGTPPHRSKKSLK